MPTRLSFRVDLLDGKPPIWRSFDLIGNPTFKDLHRAIQDACGWSDGHLYMFMDREYEFVLCEFVGEGEPCEASEAAKVRVSKHLTQTGYDVLHHRDFGRGCAHCVRLVEKRTGRTRGRARSSTVVRSKREPPKSSKAYHSVAARAAARLLTREGPKRGRGASPHFSALDASIAMARRGP